MSEKKRVGLIAGRGRLPFDALREINSRGFEAVVVGLSGEVDPELSRRGIRYQTIAPGKLGAMIAFLKEHKVAEVVFAGKVGKEAIFSGGFDLVFQEILRPLARKNDDAILGAVADEFEKSGITVSRQTDYLQNLLAGPGEISGKLSPAELADVKLGFLMAKAAGGLDIGQSVAVKQGVVLAVEAIEGTDQAIIRGGALGGAGAVIVKVSKPKQDERFDVPTVGVSTIEAMIQAQAAVLALEAFKTLITQKEGLIKLAGQNGIKIIAVTEADSLG